MAKLTLSVDDKVIKRAKRYARQHDISISSIVENYLAAVSAKETPPFPDTPSLRRLRGIAKGAGDIEDYHKYLARKYR